MLNFVSNRFVIMLRPPPGGPIAAINCILWIYFLVCFWRSYLSIPIQYFTHLLPQIINNSIYILWHSCFFFYLFLFIFLFIISFLHLVIAILPKPIIDQLSNQFERRLRAVFLFHGHIEIVHKSDHGLTACGNVNTFRSLLQSTCYSILNQES